MRPRFYVPLFIALACLNLSVAHDRALIGVTMGDQRELITPFTPLQVNVFHTVLVLHLHSIDRIGDIFYECVFQPALGTKLTQEAFASTKTLGLIEGRRVNGTTLTPATRADEHNIGISSTGVFMGTLASAGTANCPSGAKVHMFVIDIYMLGSPLPVSYYLAPIFFNPTVRATSTLAGTAFTSYNTSQPNGVVSVSGSAPYTFSLNLLLSGADASKINLNPFMRVEVSGCPGSGSVCGESPEFIDLHRLLPLREFLQHVGSGRMDMKLDVTGALHITRASPSGFNLFSGVHHVFRSHFASSAQWGTKRVRVMTGFSVSAVTVTLSPAAGFAAETDLHSTRCSGAGYFNQISGTCDCMPGAMGPTCDRLVVTCMATGCNNTCPNSIGLDPLTNCTTCLDRFLPSLDLVTGSPVCADCDSTFSGPKCVTLVTVADPLKSFCINGTRTNANSGSSVCSCSPGFTGPRCELHTNSSVNANTTLSAFGRGKYCNGKGDIHDWNSWVVDGQIVADFTCLCDHGFTGPTCARSSCDSGSLLSLDSDCTKCVETATDSTAYRVRFKSIGSNSAGLFPYRPERQLSINSGASSPHEHSQGPAVCLTCATGYEGPDCLFANDSIALASGLCRNGTTFNGRWCSCQYDFVGPFCNISDAVYNSTMCSSRGSFGKKWATVPSIHAGTYVSGCICNQDFWGPNCASANTTAYSDRFNFSSEICSSHGVPSNMLEASMCTCESGYYTYHQIEQDSVSLASLKVWDTIPPECNLNQTACDAQYCHGNGVCADTYANGSLVVFSPFNMYCMCQESFSGPRCEVNLGTCRSDMCHDRGECVLSSFDGSFSSCDCDSDDFSSLTRCATGLGSMFVNMTAPTVVPVQLALAFKEVSIPSSDTAVHVSPNSKVIFHGLIPSVSSIGFRCGGPRSFSSLNDIYVIKASSAGTVCVKTSPGTGANANSSFVDCEETTVGQIVSVTSNWPPGRDCLVLIAQLVGHSSNGSFAIIADNQTDFFIPVQYQSTYQDFVWLSEPGLSIYNGSVKGITVGPGSTNVTMKAIVWTEADVTPELTDEGCETSPPTPRCMAATGVMGHMVLLNSSFAQFSHEIAMRTVYDEPISAKSLFVPHPFITHSALLSTSVSGMAAFMRLSGSEFASASVRSAQYTHGSSVFSSTPFAATTSPSDGRMIVMLRGVDPETGEELFYPTLANVQTAYSTAPLTADQQRLVHLRPIRLFESDTQSHGILVRVGNGHQIVYVGDMEGVGNIGLIIHADFIPQLFPTSGPVPDDVLGVSAERWMSKGLVTGQLDDGYGNGVGSIGKMAYSDNALLSEYAHVSACPDPARSVLVVVRSTGVSAWVFSSQTNNLTVRGENRVVSSIVLVDGPCTYGTWDKEGRLFSVVCNSHVHVLFVAASGWAEVISTVEYEDGTVDLVAFINPPDTPQPRLIGLLTSAADSTKRVFVMGPKVCTRVFILFYFMGWIIYVLLTLQITKQHYRLNLSPPI